MRDQITISFITADELTALVRKTYGLEQYSFLRDRVEPPNPFLVEAINKPLTKRDVKTLSELIEAKIPGMCISLLFQDLCVRGKIAPGNYIIWYND